MSRHRAGEVASALTITSIEGYVLHLLKRFSNLRDAIRGDIEYTSPEGKRYALDKQTATLLVRPRGWHLHEKHLRIDGRFVSGSLFDFGLYLFHNARALLAKGTGPYFYLPKLESHLEARLWNDVFVFAQGALGIPSSTIRATVLIETTVAAFEMDEILYELRDHVAGLNCGRWDYIFSFIKKFRNRPDFVLPDRSLVTMTTPFLRSYSLLAIQTCHRRGASAIGGMAAQIPIKNDPQANAAALQMVREDKEREAGDGHDGTWVAHPGLVPVALEIFNAKMPQPNQIDRLRDDLRVTARNLLHAPRGPMASSRGGIIPPLLDAADVLEPIWWRNDRRGCGGLASLSAVDQFAQPLRRRGRGREGERRGRLRGRLSSPQEKNQHGAGGDRLAPKVVLPPDRVRGRKSSTRGQAVQFVAGNRAAGAPLMNVEPLVHWRLPLTAGAA